ncbi:hypothetical protein LCGC14_1054220 [marine sediment metagenome]|uniref:Uncharacterized protein n=1 Tax=marine sediment metagenome TaxID=412755 RepID=A0A0F9MMX7_9ZZZZ
MSIRNYTIYMRDNGLKLIELLNKKKIFSFKDFFEWFKISNKSKEEKEINVNRMIL